MSHRAFANGVGLLKTVFSYLLMPNLQLCT